MDGPRREAHDRYSTDDKGKSSAAVILGRTTGKL
jgi:hypothetical protein